MSAQTIPTRQLAAILAADVVGFSSMMEDDETGTLARLNHLFAEVTGPAIASCGGRVFKTMGDGFLAEFPAAIDAVSCALTIQDAVSGRLSKNALFKLRVGVHIGEVVRQEDGDVFGETVNITARLESLAENGGICISGSAYDQLHVDLQTRFHSHGPQTLKNIRKTITVYGTAGIRVAFEKRSDLADKPSLIVLPFRDIGENSPDDYFADGVVEDLITRLVSYKWLYVLGRNSTFSVQSKFASAEAKANFGVRYVLEGSIRRSQDRMRLTTQLLEARTGRNIWGKRFDGNLSDVFALQDEITSGIVATIEPALRRSEMHRLRRKATTDFTAYDLYLQGLEHFYRNDNLSIHSARTCFERAVAQDKGYAEAWAMIANCASRSALDGWADDIDQSVSQACSAAATAVQLDEGNGVVLAWASWVLALMAGKVDEARDLADRAMDLVPNSATALGLVSWVYLWSGEFEQTLTTLAKAVKLDPLDPRRAYMRGATAFTYFFQKKYTESIAISSQLADELPAYKPAQRVLAASYAVTGDLDRAKKVMSGLLNQDPSLRLTTVKRFCMFREPWMRERYLSALRASGIPE